MSEQSTDFGQPVDEDGVAQRANWLRAGVLGSNDGIVSVAAIVVGAAGATGKSAPTLIARLTALVAGAVSMVLGEYVSSAANSIPSEL